MSLDKINSILLLGAGNHVALPVIRALGSVVPDNVSLYTLSDDHDEFNFPRFSRYVSAHYTLQSQNDDELCHELLYRIKETDANVLLPLNEHYVRTLSKLQCELADKVHIPPLPSVDIFDSLVNKNKLDKLLQKYGFPHALSHTLQNGNLEQLHADFYPCLLKPVRGSSGRGIKKVTCRDHLRDILKNIDKNKYILQEYIPGEDIDCSFFAINGQIKALTVQRGLKSRGFSFSTAIEFVDDPVIEETAEKLVRLTGYSGLAHLDFRRDKRDGQPKLIDFNARFWLSLLGSQAAGVNFTLLYCFAAMGISFDKPEVQKINYMMGSSALQHYYNKLFPFKSPIHSNSISTDLWGRVRDPLPEIARYFHERRMK